MSDDLAGLIAKKFIARSDVKAMQRPDGSYTPVQTYSHDGTPPVREPFMMSDLEAHLAGTKTFGHYLVNKENQAKLFCFDIDLEQTGFLPTEYDDAGVPLNFVEVPDLRAAWRDRSHPGRRFMKIQFQELGHRLAAAIVDMIDIPCAVAYSGNKGIHVYGFTGILEAGEVRNAAKIVLDGLGTFQLKQDKPNNQHFYEHKNRDPVDGYPNLSIELYPKQDSLDTKDLGNLLRLPLGRNLKSEDPTFFLDMTAPLSAFQPLDALTALTTVNPFATRSI